jgi:predicted nucleic acid-binding Zn ribbon protein
LPIRARKRSRYTLVDQSSTRPVTIAEGLVGLLDSQFLQAALQLGRVMNVWKEAAGEAAACSRPVKLDKGKLKVDAKDSAWANEIQLRSEEIRRRVNEALGSNVVREIAAGVGFRE